MLARLQVRTRQISPFCSSQLVITDESASAPIGYVSAPQGGSALYGLPVNPSWPPEPA